MFILIHSFQFNSFFHSISFILIHSFHFRVAKDRQAAEAAKNASILLEELDRESKLEESKRLAAQRKREKKKRRKQEKQKVNQNNCGGFDENELGGGDKIEDLDLDEDKENNSEVTTAEDRSIGDEEKEKTPDQSCAPDSGTIFSFYIRVFQGISKFPLTLMKN